MTGRADSLAAVFDLLDRWRHFPSYQLERRADIFFALYLPGIIQRALGVKVDARMIPEFPIKREDNNQSAKVDCFLLSEDRTRAFLVEFKTDLESRNAGQDVYLAAVKDRELMRLLDEIPVIAAASNQEAKYVHLLSALEELGLVSLPSDLFDFAVPRPRRGIRTRLGAVRSVPTEATIEIVYIQPRGTDEEGVVSFHQVADYLRTLDDSLAITLAKHVERWADPAAMLPPRS